MNESASAQTKPLPVECRNCGGTQLTWSCHPINQGGVVDGRIRMSEVGVVFALGCSECSETLARVSGEQFAERFAAAEKQLGTYQQALWLSLDMAFDYTRGGVLGWYWTSRDASLKEVSDVAIAMIRDNHPDALAEQKTDGSEALIKVISERDDHYDILTRALQALPVGNIRTRTLESIPGRIDELVKRYAETDKLEAERDEALAKLAALEAKRDKELPFIAEGVCRLLDDKWDAKIEDADDNHHSEMSGEMIATRDLAKTITKEVITAFMKKENE